MWCALAFRLPRPLPSRRRCSHCCRRRIVRAAELTGSPWLAMDSSGAPTFAHLAREIGLDSLLLGYREATLFAPLDARPAADGAVARRAVLVVASGTIWLAAGAVPGIAARPFGVAAPHHGRRGSAVVRHPPDVPVRAGPLVIASPAQRGRVGEGVHRLLLLLLGLALCATKDWHVVEVLRLWLGHTEFASAPRPVPVPEPTWRRRVVSRRPLVSARLADAGERPMPPPWAPVVRHLPAALPDPVHPGCLAFIPRVAPSAVASFVLSGADPVRRPAFERRVDRPAIALSRRIDVPPLVSPRR